ncbi:MAG: dihydroorotate dehydrogenase B catalytic subunit [Candidatus Omnitrophica bacterium CG11_big_fil_rev_8_21_14_0_20_64_10]|nr:MAG: dihydroorotate dehydrogenase B catalytic subunit [Candidatus Omnitrophica bacterium CG11_big_fil_rev_8_21_14_0_20_64_10]
MKRKSVRSAAVSLRVRLGRLTLQNPILVASGTFGYGAEYARLFDVDDLGGVVTKSISLKPRPGNPAPRIWETASGMLNAIGLQNTGVEEFLRSKMLFLKKLTRAKVIVNIIGERIGDYAQIARRLDGVPGIDGLELNLSCPNCERGGIEFGVNPRMTAEAVRRVRKATRLPVIAKLSPNVTDITAIARAAADGGADALSLINTLLALAVDPESWKPRIAPVTGGLSGPAVKPVALRMVWQVHRALPKMPLIGIGGIMRSEDVVEFLLCGASAVEIGTANYIRPTAAPEAVQGLARYLKRKGLRSPGALVGRIQTPARLRGIPKLVASRRSGSGR